MKKISRLENIKKEINSEIGFKNKNKYKKEEFKIYDSKNDLSRY